MLNTRRCPGRSWEWRPINARDARAPTAAVFETAPQTLGLIAIAAALAAFAVDLRPCWMSARLITIRLAPGR